MYSVEYLQKVARDILVVQPVIEIFFVSFLVLVALEGRISVRMHRSQQVNHL